MSSEHTIHTLPPPPQLALPLAADAILQVKVGDRLCSGAVLAVGGSGADILAPMACRVAGFARKPLAAGGNAWCVLLDELSPQTPSPVHADSLPILLKRAGVVGLGGGGFPAWRKWRRGLRWFIANGLETEPAAHHDAALLAASGDALTGHVQAVARAFAAAPLLAVPPHAPLTAHKIIRRLPPHYALGNERLLLHALCGITLPPQDIMAEYGAVCFNIATVLAMAAAIEHGTPHTQRLLTVHGEEGDITILQLPFGTSVGDVRRFMRSRAAARAGGCDEQQQVEDDAVLTAASTVLRFDSAPRRAALPCINCGACAPVCPAALAPQRLYQLAQDAHWTAMQEARLEHCLACRRCDEVCPSNIPLTATFIASKKTLAAQQAAQAQLRHRRVRFERHSARLSQPQARVARHTLHRHVQEAVAKAHRGAQRVSSGTGSTERLTEK